MIRAASLTAFAAGLLAVLPALAGESAAPPVAGVPLLLEPGKAVEIICNTKAVVVATDAANATSGSLRLKLLTTAESAGAAGSWSAASVDTSHKGSLAAMQAKACASGCPMIYDKGADVQLWAPAPKGIDKLGPDEILLLAVLKTANMQLKASTFRGQQIEALESGTCEIAAPEANPQPSGAKP